MIGLLIFPLLFHCHILAQQTRIVRVMGLYDIRVAQDSNGECSDDVDAVYAMLVVAHDYEIKKANKRLSSIGVQINSTMFDACASDTVGIRQALKIMDEITYTTVMHAVYVSFILSTSTSGVTKVLSIMANDYDNPIPVIASQATTPELDNEAVYANFVRTIPSDKNQVAALHDILIKMELTWVNVVGDQSDYSSGLIYKFRGISNTIICIEKFVVLEEDNKWSDVEAALQASQAMVTLLLLGTQAARQFFDTILSSSSRYESHIFVGVDAWSGLLRTMDWTGLNWTAITTQPKPYGAVDPSFIEYVANTSIAEAVEKNDAYLTMIIESYHNCTFELNLESIGSSPVEKLRACNKNYTYAWYDIFNNTLFVRQSIEMIVQALENLHNNTFDSNRTDIDSVTGQQLVEFFKNTTFHLEGSNWSSTSFQLNGNSGGPYYDIYKHQQINTSVIGYWNGETSRVSRSKFILEFGKKINDTCRSINDQKTNIIGANQKYWIETGRSCCFIEVSCFAYWQSLEINSCQTCDQVGNQSCYAYEFQIDCNNWLESFEKCLPYQDPHIFILHILTAVGIVTSIGALFLFYYRKDTPVVRLLSLHNFSMYPLSAVLIFLVGPVAIVSNISACLVGWLLLSLAMILPPTSANLRMRKLRVMRSDISINKYVRRASRVTTAPECSGGPNYDATDLPTISTAGYLEKCTAKFRGMVKTICCFLSQVILTTLWLALNEVKMSVDHSSKTFKTVTYCSTFKDEYSMLLFLVPVIFTVYNVYLAYQMSKHTVYATPIREARQIITCGVITLILVIIFLGVFYDGYNLDSFPVGEKWRWLYIYAICRGLTTVLLNILPDVRLLMGKETNHIDYLLKRRGPKTRPKGLVGYFSDWRQRTSSRNTVN